MVPVRGTIIDKKLMKKVERLGIQVDEPDFLFEGANGMGGGHYMREGIPYITAYAKALKLSRKEFVLLLKERASMGERLSPMYYEHLMEYDCKKEMTELVCCCH